MDSDTQTKTFSERMAEWDEEALRTILKMKWGRRFVWRLMSRCGIFTQSFVPGEPEATAFNEGRRSIGNTLLRQVMEINPESYLQMVKVQKKEDEYARSESRPDPDDE